MGIGIVLLVQLKWEVEVEIGGRDDGGRSGEHNNVIFILDSFSSM